MLNLDEIERYDGFWQRPPRRYETRSSRWGSVTRATVIAKATGRASFGADAVEARDVVVLGAGPSGMLMAAYLAHAGHHVTILERHSRLFCGATWNLGRDEFEALARTPPLTPAEWRSCVTGDFEHGVFRLHDPDSGGIERDFSFEGCLNVSLDEERYYVLLGRRQPNLELRTGTSGELEELREEGAYVRWRGAEQSGVIRARLLIDASGWRSPLALAVHPERKVESVYNMLGVVVRLEVGWGGEGWGRAKRDARGYSLMDACGNPLGIICATYRNAILIDGTLAQGIVERFSDFVQNSPEHDGRSDILYYFTRTPEPARLQEMVKSMLASLREIAPDIDEGRIEKVFYGHAPAYYAPGPLDRWRVQTSAGDRLWMIGAAAQQYSGLTGCAFGALARNAARMGREIDQALRRDELDFGTLARIDIDPRERTSQSIGAIFGGTMAVSGADEDSFSPNRDWLILCEAAERAGLDAALMGEAFKDKMRFSTVNKLLAMLRVDPRVAEVMLRNNAGGELAALWTVGRGYLSLMSEEVRRFQRTGNRKYLAGIASALRNLPGVMVSGVVVLARRAPHLGSRVHAGGRKP